MPSTVATWYADSPAPPSSSAGATYDAMKASISSSLTVESASTPSNALTAYVLPTSTTMRRNKPASVASTVPSILSVSTAMSSSPTATSTPSDTSTSTTVPSFIDRPHFGITTGVMPSAINA